ncbi:MAG: ABC transporter ATP-binding protein [Oscillatoriales cyanobacterium SM2_1_8]|nr:ABC transporter ATP-binding protein [Oscillatoriales cyanobacterium SM2_1_8]
MAEVAIALRGVSKCFHCYDRPIDRLQELFFPKVRRSRPFWALQDLDLEVTRGQTLGVIGQNGSGKSTLLQIVAGTLTPTAGEVKVGGRISALLELGSGFNPEFTGRQNVFFNGRLLGLHAAEIEAKFDDIAAFADIGDFIEQPVKTYSSGMFVRLAFAVAVNVDPEILIVDEALAVGDVLFQRKCFRKIEELSEQGVTILFVSHDLNSVLNLCDRAIVLHGGRKIQDGKPHPVTLAYSTLMAEQEAAARNVALQHQVAQAHGNAVSESRVGIGGAELQTVELLNAQGQPVQTVQTGESLRVRSHIVFHSAVARPIAGFKIKTLNGIAVVGQSTYESPKPLPPIAADTALTVEFDWPCYLAPGNYTVTAGVSEATEDGRILPLDRRRDVLPLTVMGPLGAYGLLALPIHLDYQLARRRCESACRGS